MCLKNAIEGHGDKIQYNALGLLIRAGTHIDGAGVNNIIETSHLELPEKSFALQSVSC
jgi:hypothetical protein